MRILRKFLVFCVTLLVLGLAFQPAIASGKIDINTATVSQLVELNGIGEKTAQKIVEYRKKHKFATVDDLTNVKGIGEKTLEKIRDQITVTKKSKKKKKK